MLDYMTEGPLSTLDSLPPDTFNALVAPLWNFLAPSQQPGELTADILFVIGNIDLAIPRHAAKLFMEGYAPAVLISGGQSPRDNDSTLQSEAHTFADVMIHAGVPEDAITLQGTGTNPEEKITRGMTMLHDHDTVPRSLILVAKSFLMRRALTIFAQHYPDITVVPSPPAGPASQYIDRPRHEFTQRLLDELEQLRQATAGSQQALIIPEDVLTAELTLSQFLAKQPL